MLYKFEFGYKENAVAFAVVKSSYYLKRGALRELASILLVPRHVLNINEFLGNIILIRENYGYRIKKII